MSGRKQFEPEVALDAAVRVFWRKSYTAASLADLTAATGLSRASLYATFGDKQDLFLACLYRYVDQVSAWIDCTLHEEHDGGDHTIVVGRVTGLGADSERVPLLYHRGAYGVTAPLPTPTEESA